MRYSRVLQRRLDRLESVSPVSSTEDKWNTIHVRALELMSEEDLRSSRRSRRCEIHLRRPGKPQRGPPRPHGVEEATTTAVSDANVRFTMSELDQLLAAE